MASIGGQYTITASAVNLTTALGLTKGDLPSGGYHCSEITVKNANGAANTLFAGGSNVTNVPANAHVQLAAGQSFTWLPSVSARPTTDEIYLVGTANAANIAFIEITV